VLLESCTNLRTDISLSLGSIRHNGANVAAMRAIAYSLAGV
jgi:hypothetical protein